MSSGINRRVLIALVGVAGAMLLAPVSARASLAITSPGVFSSTKTVIGFEVLPYGQVTSASAALLVGSGITFPVLDGESAIFGSSFTKTIIDVIGSGAGSDGKIEIAFDSPVEAAGVNYWTGSPLVFSAYDSSDVLIGTADSLPVGAGFFGVDGQGVGISRVVINDHSYGFQIDDLTFGSTTAAVHAPAPGAAALAGLGLLLVGLGRRRLA